MNDRLFPDFDRIKAKQPISPFDVNLNLFQGETNERQQ